MFMLWKRMRAAWRTPWQRVLIVMFIAQLMTAIGFSSIFPFLPLYVNKLGSSTGSSLELLAGLVYSGQAFTMMLTAPFWGALADRYGRKLMVERAMFGGTLILLAMAFARSAEDLVLLRTLQGLITGTIAAANALVASVAPREHSGYAMGLLQVGQGAGVALGPMIGGAIADAYGYSAAFYVTAFMLLLGGLLVYFGVQENFTPVVKGSVRRSVWDSWREIFTSMGASVTYAIGFISNLGRNMLIAVLPMLIAALLGPSAHINIFTGVVVGVASGTTTLSSVFFGRLGDRTSHRIVLVASLVAGGLLYLPQAVVTQAWHILILQALVGVALGGVIPAYSALLARYTRPGLEGAVYGLDNAIGSGARAIAPMIGSAIAVSWGLRPPLAVAGLVLLCAGIMGGVFLPKHEALPLGANQ